ncbi:hypothetical protein Mgra_00005133 [Meloidogyne graminicola]|uniref:Transmembrane protein n=1 Tax=Meloidogyne graminicola TaxID=189291 RepID=A0A8S9ZPF3_9BILA|nr:hypothetical protein Mgra_00005133 [Meloidogyne graminicola]
MRSGTTSFGSLMLLFLLIFINFFYKNVQPFSIFVKIEWKEDSFHYHQLASKNTKRFNLELTSSEHYIDGSTNKYDFSELSFKDLQDERPEPIYSFNLKVRINGSNKIIASIDNIKNYAIVYITLPIKNPKNIINIVKDNEEYYNQIINLFKYPVRILQFILQPNEKYSKIRIKCKNKKNNKFNAKFNRNYDNEGNAYLETEYFKSKVCPNDQYIVEKDGREIELNCNTAINHSNVYLINLNERICKLIQQDSINFGDVKNQLTQSEKNAEEILKSSSDECIRNNESNVYIFYPGNFVPHQLQQNIQQSQSNQNVPRRRPQQRQRSARQPQQLGIRLESIQEGIEEGPGSSRKGKGKNVVETQTKHSSDSKHTIPQLHGQQHLREGSSIPENLQGGFMGATSFTDKQINDLIAANRFNLSQGGQGIFQDVQQTHEGGTSSTRPQQNVEHDNQQDDYHFGNQ